MKRDKLVFTTLVYRVMLIHEANVEVAEKRINSPYDAARIVLEYLPGVDREHFVGLYMNSANRLIGLHTISIGILNSSLVHPREFYKIAFYMSAASVIAAHNHPS